MFFAMACLHFTRLLNSCQDPNMDAKGQLQYMQYQLLDNSHTIRNIVHINIQFCMFCSRQSESFVETNMQ